MTRPATDKPRKLLIVDDQAVLVDLTPAAQMAISEWIGAKLAELELVLDSFGVSPEDIVAPTFQRHVYADEIIPPAALDLPSGTSSSASSEEPS